MGVHNVSDSPLVSVLCLSYNHENYIRQALESILMQTYDFPIEVLVGEDCSPDHSREIFREYKEKYPNLFFLNLRDQNVGATKNIYDLQMKARGKYLIVLETDDYWLDPLKLKKQVDFLEAHPEYIGCSHVCQVVDEFCRPSVKAPEHVPEQGLEITLDDFLHKGFIFQTATLMYRNFFLDGNDYSIITKAHHLVFDLTVCTILLKKGNIFLLPECMTAYRRVVKKGGTSAASLAAAFPTKSLLSMMKQLSILDEYFGGSVDFTPMQIYPVEKYLTCLLRRYPDFTWSGMSYMWGAASPAARRKVIRFALGFPFRKIKKLAGGGHTRK